MSASDADLVDDVRRGNRDAFGQLIERYQGRLFGLVLMMVRRPAAAEEVTQDALVRAYTHIHRYDPTRAFYPWLAAIAARLAQNWLRQRTREVRREAEPVDGAFDAGIPAKTLAALIADERNLRLWKEVAALPSGERTAVFLYYRDEMTVGDIARALGVSAGTIKTLLFRGRRHLRQRLQVASSPRQETAP